MLFPLEGKPSLKALYALKVCHRRFGDGDIIHSKNKSLRFLLPEDLYFQSRSGLPNRPEDADGCLPLLWLKIFNGHAPYAT
jgi:hypothetical protein